MDFQFVIPLTANELLNSSGDSYYVKNDYSVQEIPSKLCACKDIFHTKGPEHILEEFDTYFAIINADNTNTRVHTYLIRAFDLLYVTAVGLGKKLTALFANPSENDIPDRNTYLNLTKMTLYLLINVVKKIDEAVENVNKEQQKTTLKKSRKGTETMAPETFPDWPNRRNKFMTQLFNLMALNLPRLWNPPVPDETFVNMVCMICCRTIEQAPQRADESHVGNTAFQILGLAIKRYNYAITFPTQILQILRDSEHTATTVANGIKLLHEEFGITSVFSVLAQEITNSLDSDSGDSVVARNYSNFLMKLGTIAPNIVIPHISSLSEEWLNTESIVLRNCILQLMGDSILGELTGENLSEENRDIRDEFLDDLVQHILDISAHVRSKVLQIWNILVTNKAVPLAFIKKLLPEVVDRLNDKTATVRKYAAQLIRSLLENNPYSGKLSIEDIQKNLAEAKVLRDELAEKVEKEKEKLEELGLNADVEKEIRIILVNELKSVPIIPDGYEEETEDEFKLKIGTFLIEKKYKEAIVLCRRYDKTMGVSEAMLSMEHNFEDLVTYFLMFLKAILLTSNGVSDSSKKFDDQCAVISYFEDALQFSELIAQAIKILETYLYSKTNSDVLEAVQLFSKAYLFDIAGTQNSMLKMLHLVWSSEKEKKEAVSNAFKEVLFNTCLSGKLHAITASRNLINYLKVLNYDNYLGLEVLIHEWVETEVIDNLMIQVLFEFYTKKLQDQTEEESLLALKLLTLCANKKHSIASANIEVIEEISLGQRGKMNPGLYSNGLLFLNESTDPDSQIDRHRMDKRFSPENALAIKAVQIYEGFFMNAEVEDFDCITDSFVEFLYHLCQQPDLICYKILKNLVTKMRNVCSGQQITNSQQVEQMETPFSQPIMPSQEFTQAPLHEQSQPNSELFLPATYLARFLHMIGCMVLKELIFLDIDVYNNMKYRQELAEWEEKKQKNRKTLNLRPSLNLSASLSLKRLSEAGGDKEPDEDLVGASAEDTVAEQINHICEVGLLQSEKSILRKLTPFILEICKFPLKYKDERVQQAALTALIRIMCASSVFCTKFMSFLINILTATQNTAIKCNIIIGMSDLTFRFPNVTEPYIIYMYNMVHDSNTILRLTAVRMLSHLILHEMIRVKGQIADLALGIVDEDEDIKARTHQFFREIANKANILYNVLPDIISKLSDEHGSVPEEKYQSIMRYILSLIQKDRHVETLVEKLCMRFPITRQERQWRDIAFCLSLLTYNERSIKKLTDNIGNIKDKVQVPEVYDAFKLIINNTSKLAKPELKAMVTELEARINECLEVRGEEAENGDNNEANSASTQRTTGPGDKKQTRPSAPVRGKQTQRGRNAAKKQLQRGKRKNQPQSNSDSDESSSSESE